MTPTLLHLIDVNGVPVDAAIALGVNRAFIAALNEYRHLDSCLLANWAEEVALSMQPKSAEIQFPRGYALTALRWKIKGYYKLKKANYEFVGLCSELEITAGGSAGRITFPEYTSMLHKVRLALTERENVILDLLLQGYKYREIQIRLGLGVGNHCVSNTKTKIRGILTGRNTAKNAA